MEKIFTLQLSDMRAPKYEHSTVLFAWATTREALEKLLEDEKVDRYDEDGQCAYGSTTYMKNFRKDGPLEWANPPGVDGTTADGHPAIREFDPIEFTLDALNKIKTGIFQAI